MFVITERQIFVDFKILWIWRWQKYSWNLNHNYKKKTFTVYKCLQNKYKKIYITDLFWLSCLFVYLICPLIILNPLASLEVFIVSSPLLSAPFIHQLSVVQQVSRHFLLFNSGDLSLLQMFIVNLRLILLYFFVYFEVNPNVFLTLI